MTIEITKNEIVYDGEYIRVIKRHFLHNGKAGVWEFVERKKSGPSVAIFALTPTKEIIMEKIFRLPFNTLVVELPAGLTDIDGESSEEAAKRELLEETGYAAKTMTKILQGPVSTGTTTEEMIIFFAEDAEKVKEPDLEMSEEIEVFTLPVENLPTFIQENQEHMKIDVKILSVLAYLKEKNILS